MGSVVRLNSGTKNAGIGTRAASSYLRRAPAGPVVAATTPGLLFLRLPSARALPATTTPVDSGAWRTPAGITEPGNLCPREARSESPQGRFCSELTAQELTLRPREPGLPHHRHPMTADEALAGFILLATISAALGYLAWVAL